MATYKIDEIVCFGKPGSPHYRELKVYLEFTDEMDDSLIAHACGGHRNAIDSMHREFWRTVKKAAMDNCTASAAAKAELFEKEREDALVEVREGVEDGKLREQVQAGDLAAAIIAKREEKGAK